MVENRQPEWSVTWTQSPLAFFNLYDVPMRIAITCIVLSGSP